MKKRFWVFVLVGSAAVGVACGGDDDGGRASARGGGAGECEGVDTAELEDVWGDVAANPVGGICSILVADGKMIMLTKADGAGGDGYQELVDDVVGAESGEAVDIADRAERFTGTSAGDIYVVLVGDVAIRVSAVDLPPGQMEATARSIAGNL